MSNHTEVKMTKCFTCKYWDELSIDGVGVCAKITETHRKQLDILDINIPGITPYLITTPDFYCALHTPDIIRDINNYFELEPNGQETEAEKLLKQAHSEIIKLRKTIK